MEMQEREKAKGNSEVFVQRLFRASVFWLPALLLPLQLEAIDAPLASEVPLGMAYDGRVIWIGDARSRELNGYDTEEKQWFRTQRPDVSQLRGMAFVFPEVLSVVPGYVIFINPVNGNFLRRQVMSELKDPVSIAVSEEAAYIYDRDSQRIYRYMLNNWNTFGSFSVGDLELRGMTWHDGALWAVARNSRIYKLNAETGEVLSFLPVPGNSYGAAFVEGMLHVVTPEGVHAIDFIDGEYYVASDQVTYRVSMELESRNPWSDVQRQQEPDLNISGLFFRSDFRQRILQPRSSLSSLRRVEGNEYLLNISKEEHEKEQKISFRAITYNTVYIFNKSNMKKYFAEKNLPEYVLPYVKNSDFPKETRERVKPLLKEWKEEVQGRHPVYSIAFILSGESDMEARKYSLRETGIPTREVVVYDTKSKETKNLLEVYIRPAGWIILSPEYSPDHPLELPVSGNILELYSPDTIQVSPDPLDAEGKKYKAPDVISLESVLAIQNE